MLAKSMHQIARIEFRNSKFPFARGLCPLDPCQPAPWNPRHWLTIWAPPFQRLDPPLTTGTTRGGSSTGKQRGGPKLLTDKGFQGADPWRGSREQSRAPWRGLHFGAAPPCVGGKFCISEPLAWFDAYFFCQHYIEYLSFSNESVISFLNNGIIGLYENRPFILLMLVPYRILNIVRLGLHISCRYVFINRSCYIQGQLEVQLWGSK